MPLLTPEVSGPSGEPLPAQAAYGTVLAVPLDELPDWLPAWCLEHLGAEPAGVLFQLKQVSMVLGPPVGWWQGCRGEGARR
jgi:hypothetical protein